MVGELSKLLSEIQSAVACPYLSDLHVNYGKWSKNTRAQVMKIPDETYTLDTWVQAASYISDKPCQCSTIAETKKIIIGR